MTGPLRANDNKREVPGSIFTYIPVFLFVLHLNKDRLRFNLLEGYFATCLSCMLPAHILGP